MKKEHSDHFASDAEKLEAFLLHTLDKAEESDFNAHMNVCTDCRRLVQEERELLAGIKRFGRLEMKRRLKQQIRHGRTRQFEWTQIASIAAAIVVIFSAAMAIRWFVTFEHQRNREVILKPAEASQQALWIIGKVVVQKREFRGAISRNNSSFIVQQGFNTQTVSIRYANFSELPANMRHEDNSSVQTFLERTPKGLHLTLYVDSQHDSLATGIEAINSDSLIVLFNDRQIAYHIPGGWSGRM
jgi:hypothetical protein